MNRSGGYPHEVDFASLSPLAGGWSGETFVAEAGGERQVVRIHARRPQRAEVDAALLRMVRGLLPVPHVVEVRRPSADLPALLITSFLPGERGDLVLPRLDTTELATMGRHVGDLVAVLGGMPWPRAGAFVDGELGVATWELPDGLAALVAATDLSHWTPEERTGLARVAETAQALLDTVARTCLVHSDLNPKNLLVDPESLTITGLVDWEYAHAGHPFTDLGNVLRFDRHPAYVAGVLAAYQARRGTAPAEALALARAADLWALVDLAARSGENPVATRADVLLRAIARQQDVGAEV